MIRLFDKELEKDELVNQLTHFPGIILGVFFLIALAIKGYGESPINLFSYVIYAITYILVFGASTVYHSQKCDQKKDFFQKVDHASIYVFMAGCYTPFVIIFMKEEVKYLFLFMVWTLAMFGVLYKIFSAYKNRMYSTVLYFVFGFMCFLAKDALLDQIPVESYKLLVYGGIFYSIGAVFYMLESIPYSHGIWHGFVVVASSLHFMAIYLS